MALSGSTLACHADNPPMHWIVAYAGWPADGRQGTAPSRALDAMLGRWSIVHRDEGDLDDASMPHERAWARAVGLTPHQGLIPWAAALAADDGITFDDQPVALLSPTHWRVTADHVALLDPEALQLDAQASRSLWASVSTLLQEGGYRTQWGHATRWYASHADWSAMPSASIDRVVNRGIEPWRPSGESGRRWQRLQNEIQMLLHTDGVNDDRAARGQWPINSVWLSGNGPAWPAPQRIEHVRVDRRLRSPYLASDIPSWLTAWQQLDADVLTPWLADSPPDARLTLCGERSSITWSPTGAGWWQRLTSPRAPDAVACLARL